MTLPVPSIVDHTKKWFRLLKQQPESPSISHDETAGTGAFVGWKVTIVVLT
jgi:hypothetical protein